MFKRHTLLAMMLVGSVGIPFLTSSSANIRKTVSGLWPAATDTPEGPAASETTGDALVKVPAGKPFKQAQPTQVLRPPVSMDPADVLRFDVSTGWVMHRWERVSAGLADIDLQGYRVPLVTGTREDDLAGSLTYYFDKKQQVQRITFHGTTGNPSKLVALVTSRYNFRRQVTDDPGTFLYQVKWNGKPWSELRMKTARVVRSDAPHSRFEIDLAMRRP